MINKRYSRQVRKKLAQIRRITYSELEAKKREEKIKTAKRRIKKNNLQPKLKQKKLSKNAFTKIKNFFKKEKERKIARIALEIIQKHEGNVAWEDVYSLTLNQFGNTKIGSLKNTIGIGTIQKICKQMIKEGIIKIE
jgi:hypothetical protein